MGIIEWCCSSLLFGPDGEGGHALCFPSNLFHSLPYQLDARGPWCHDRRMRRPHVPLFPLTSNFPSITANHGLETPSPALNSSNRIGLPKLFSVKKYQRPANKTRRPPCPAQNARLRRNFRSEVIVVERNQVMHGGLQWMPRPLDTQTTRMDAKPTPAKFTCTLIWYTL